MAYEGITEDAFITLVESRLHASYTDEQRKLVKLTGSKPVFCFADPGTGKTFTAVGGLLDAELYKMLPGEEIYALSFTNMATGELAVRHEKACRACECSQMVKFSTLHSLCMQLLTKNYRLLGMTTMNPGGNMPIDKQIQLIESICKEEGVALDQKTMKAVARACTSLNSSLVFDEDNVTAKMDFKQTGVEFDIFEKIRGGLFTYSLLSQSIAVSDILLYTLLLMQKFPEVSAEFKSHCKMMLVDEAQDLSLLQLKVISMLTDNPVFIGDRKQQIYAFNGACQEIVEAFFKLYPDAETCQLTKSFRCKQEIADFATRIIAPNKIGGEDFKGVSEGGSVTMHAGYSDSGLNLSRIVSNMREEFISNLNKFERDYLFLFRNNASAIPCAEELYKNGLPFRVNKYTPAFEVPVMKEMCEIIQLCANPKTPSNIAALSYLIPELRGYGNITLNPLYQIAVKSGQSVFEINYHFKDSHASETMSMLMELIEMLANGRSVKDLCNTMWPYYNEAYLKNNAWKFDSSVDYYMSMVSPVVHKTYTQFVQDELKKQNIIEESIKYKRGVRCYTMHASKGLEADVVYLVDADEGIMPNVKKLDKMLRAHCDMDAARMIREERCLCYVAATRAKDELHIVYNGEVSPILLGSNKYSNYDAVYNAYSGFGDDIMAFEGFVDRYVEPCM